MRLFFKIYFFYLIMKNLLNTHFSQTHTYTNTFYENFFKRELLIFLCCSFFCFLFTANECVWVFPAFNIIFTTIFYFSSDHKTLEVSFLSLEFFLVAVTKVVVVYCCNIPVLSFYFRVARDQNKKSKKNCKWIRKILYGNGKDSNSNYNSDKKNCNYNCYRIKRIIWCPWPQLEK